MIIFLFISLLRKVQYPFSRTLQISSRPESFICIDYDSEEEFAAFFYRCRTDILEVFRQSTLIAPLVTFSYCEHCIRLRFQKAANERSISYDIYIRIIITKTIENC